VVIELWAVEAFCLTPVIACLFFVAGVLSMLEKQVSPYACYCLSLLRGWCVVYVGVAKQVRNGLAMLNIELFVRLTKELAAETHRDYSLNKTSFGKREGKGFSEKLAGDAEWLS
jgi:hypothetical protein